MSTVVKERRLTDEEIHTLNTSPETNRVCGRGYFFGGTITEYSDGRRVGSYGYSHEWEGRVNARKIGEKMLEIFDYIDEVWHNGMCVAKR